MAEVGVYDPKAYVLDLGGRPITGYAAGSKITVVREGNQTTDVAGVDGDVAVAETHDPRATITINLLATSASNDVLSGLSRARAKFPVMLRDMAGSTAVSGIGWVQRLPDINVDAEVPVRAWEVRIAASDYHVGSSPIVGGVV